MACVRTVLFVVFVIASFAFIGCENPNNSDTTGPPTTGDDPTEEYTNTFTVNGTSYVIESLSIENRSGTRQIVAGTEAVALSVLSVPAPPDPAEFIVEIIFDQPGEIPIGTWDSPSDVVYGVVCDGSLDCSYTGDTVSDVSYSFVVDGTDGEEMTITGTVEFTYDGTDYEVTVSYRGPYGYTPLQVG